MPEENKHARHALALLGVDPDNLGCVMLNVELPKVYRDILDSDWAYYSTRLDYVKGYEGTPHVTLLYGLLFSANKHKDLVDGVLEGWHKPMGFVFDEVDDWDVNDGEADYTCLVLRPSLGDDDLKDANARLSNLPHVRSFVNYNPHVTVGYVKRQYADEARRLLDLVEPRLLFTKDLDYGD